MYSKDNMYWIADKEEELVLISFDFSSETFKDVCFCPIIRY